MNFTVVIKVLLSKVGQSQIPGERATMQRCPLETVHRRKFLTFRITNLLHKYTIGFEFPNKPSAHPRQLKGLPSLKNLGYD